MQFTFRALSIGFPRSDHVFTPSTLPSRSPRPFSSTPYPGPSSALATLVSLHALIIMPTTSAPPPTLIVLCSGTRCQVRLGLFLRRGCLLVQHLTHFQQNTAAWQRPNPGDPRKSPNHSFDQLLPRNPWPDLSRGNAATTVGGSACTERLLTRARS